MEDKTLQAQLSQLRRIKPRQDWVLLTKTRLFESAKAGLMAEAELQGSLKLGFTRFAETIRLFFAKPALVMPALAVLVGSGILFQTAQEAVPGDRLYAFREGLERLQYQVVAKDPALASLERAQRRLGDLKIVAQANRVQNLGPAIAEYENSITEASRDLGQLAEAEPGTALEVSRRVAELQAEQKNIEQVLGTSIGEDGESELAEALRALAEGQLADLAGRSLTEDQTALLEQAQTAADEEDWQAALQFIFEIGSR